MPIRRTHPVFVLGRYLLLLLVGGCCVIPATAHAGRLFGNVRLLIVTGGHDYETNQFFRMFRETADFTYFSVRHPEAQVAFDPRVGGNYDVIVLYDMWQPILPQAQSNLLARLKGGTGLVALHHSLANYQGWDEYSRIIGGKFHLNKRMVDGKELPASTYKHGVNFTVRIQNPKHFITRGLKDFNIHDETYGNLEVLPTVEPLLTTDEPTSSPTIAWTHKYGRARVVYIQLGHDHLAYENEDFRQVVRQAIRWAGSW